MAIINVCDVTRVGDGKAIGLWSVPQGKCAVVRYHDGRWYLVNEVAGFAWNNVPKKAWFLDETNFVAIGSDKVVRCVNGKVEFQALSIDGQEYPAKELTAVWGHDLSHYWVADVLGDVFWLRWNAMEVDRARSGNKTEPEVRSVLASGQWLSDRSYRK